MGGRGSCHAQRSGVRCPPVTVSANSTCRVVQQRHAGKQSVSASAECRSFGAEILDIRHLHLLTASESDSDGNAVSLDVYLINLGNPEPDRSAT